MERVSRALASAFLTTVLATAAFGAEVIAIGNAESGAAKDGALPDGALAQSGVDEGLTRIVLSPDGRRAATAGEDGKARIFDVATAKLATLAIAAHNTGCSDVCFAPDGKTLFSCGADGTAREWDLASGKELRKFEGHNGEVRCVLCSPDGQRLATTDRKGVRIWDLKTGKQLHLMIGHEVPKIPENVAALATSTALTIDSLAFSPDGRTLISEANDETARVWDTVGGKELRMVPQHDGATAAVAISPDGVLAVSTRGVISIGTIPRLRVWELATGRMLRTMLGHRDNITCDAFSPDGRYVLSGAEDRTVRQWEIDTGVEVRRFMLSSKPASLAYGPNGKTGVSASANEGVVVWDLTTPPKTTAKITVKDKDDAWQKLASPSYEDRTAAVTYYLGSSAALDDLVADMRQQVGNDQARAAQTQLIEQLGDPSYSVRTKAYEDLEQLGASAREALAAATEHPSPEVRGRVAGLLNRIGGPVDFRAVLAIEVFGLAKTSAAKAELARIVGSKLPCAAHAKAVLARAEK